MDVVIREARREDLRAIRRLVEAEPGFWQRDWSDATLAKGIETAGDLALVWEDDTAIAGFVCAHDLGFRAYLSELVVAQGQEVGAGSLPMSCYSDASWAPGPAKRYAAQARVPGMGRRGP